MSSVVTPTRTRRLWKCKACRDNKKRCDPAVRAPGEKCFTCQEKGLPCSEPIRTRARHYSTRNSDTSHSTSNASSQAGTSSSAVPNEPTPTSSDLGSIDLISLVPCGRDPDFTGREAQLQALHDIFCTSDGHHRAAITGFVGVGKSQLAIEFAYQTYGQIFQLIIWLSASTFSHFERSCQDAAAKLELESNSDLPSSAPERLRSWLFAWKEGKCLVIVDDVDSVELTAPSASNNDVSPDSSIDLPTYLSRNSHVSVLVVSRSPEAARQLVDRYDEKLHLGPMTEDEALLLLNKKKIRGDQSTYEQRKKLVGLVECLPLTLTQATSYMFRNGIQISKYVEFFNSNEVGLLERELRDPRRLHQPCNSVLKVVWGMLDSLCDNAPLALEVLSQMAILHHQRIPLALLKSAKACALDFSDAIGALLELSIIVMEPGAEALSLLSVSQLAIQTWLKRKQRLANVVEQTLNRLSTKFLPADRLNIESCYMLSPHLGRALSLIEIVQSANHGFQRRLDLTGLYRLLAVIHAKCGSYQKAEGIIRARSTLGRFSTSLTDRINLAALQICQGRTRETQKLVEETLKTSSTSAASESNKILAAKEAVAAFHAYQGHQAKYFDHTTKLYQQVLDEKQKTIGLEDSSTLATQNNLVVFYYHNNPHSGDQVIQKSILEMQQQVLDTQTRVLGPHHPSTLASKTSVTLLSYARGLWDFSWDDEHFAEHLTELQSHQKRDEETQDELIQELSELLGEKHPLTLLGMSNKAVMMSLRGKHAEAEKMQQDVVSALQNSSTEQSLQIKVSKQNLKDIQHAIEQLRLSNQAWSMYCLEPIPLVAMEESDTILICWVHMLSFMQTSLIHQADRINEMLQQT